MAFNHGIYAKEFSKTLFCPSCYSTRGSARNLQRACIPLPFAYFPLPPSVTTVPFPPPLLNCQQNPTFLPSSFPHQSTPFLLSQPTTLFPPFFPFTFIGQSTLHLICLPSFLNQPTAFFILPLTLGTPLTPMFAALLIYLPLSALQLKNTLLLGGI